ncbi:hypothetical protein BGZ82_007602 [Podila clonocystis]|nr:hypothetical protein BGZ82_007602 [Podila clonocystis]
MILDQHEVDFIASDSDVLSPATAVAATAVRASGTIAGSRLGLDSTAARRGGMGGVDLAALLPLLLLLSDVLSSQSATVLV